jgi:N-acetylglucosaminyl-diphospho-decaprenol L-rhamnosyltransferase
MTVPSLSVVIPTHDTRELTLRCLESLRDGGATPVETVVVDDASSDGTTEAVAEAEPGVNVVETGENVGFSRAVNLGVERTSGGIVLVLNSDTEVLEGGLAALMAAFAEDPELGIGGAELVNPDGSPQWRAGRWPTPTWLFAQASGLGAAAARLSGRRSGGHGSKRSGAVDWVSGAAMAVRRDVWLECGPFDEGYRFYCQDLDLCRAAKRAGRRVAVIAGFRVIHHHGATISAEEGTAGSFHPGRLWADLVRFARKDGGEDAAKRAARAIRVGARLRLIGRGIAGPFVRDRVAWRRDSDAYREGLTRV